MATDAERYQYLRKYCYNLKYPYSDWDQSMHLSFTVSGVWADNMDPAVLDSLIDLEIEKNEINRRKS